MDKKIMKLMIVKLKDTICIKVKILFGKQGFIYFIGFKDDKKIRPLCVFFPKMSAYRIDADESGCMHFMIKEEKVFDKYVEIWVQFIEKVKTIILKCFFKNIIHSDHSNDSYDKISTKKIRIMKIKGINVYLKKSELIEIEKHKKKFFFKLRKFPPEI